jgi:hypothetical protein
MKTKFIGTKKKADDCMLQQCAGYTGRKYVKGNIPENIILISS